MHRAAPTRCSASTVTTSGSAEKLMADESINKGRRRFLTASTAVIGGAGLIITAIPFVETWLPSARAESAGAPVTVAIGKVEPGQMVRYGWRSQPVFEENRTPEQLQGLPKQDPRLREPDSKEPQQPHYCQNTTRSVKPEWKVWIAIFMPMGYVT